jgi:hypothetical protein
MKELSKENIKLAQAVAKAIGFEPKVFPHYDNDNKHELDILNMVDPIDKNVTIHCTIGLSDYENLVGKQNIPVELLIAAYKKFEKAKNILSTCGFYIIKDKYECRPGSVFMRMIEFYYKDKEMKHIYFAEPFLWQDKLDQIKAENKEANFLFCIPISDAELAYKQKNGDDALESLLQENEIDIYDLDRKSVI